MLILPAMGIVAEIIANNTRKPHLGLQVPGLFRPDDRLPLLHRLGASHVSDRHGHPHRHLLPDHHDDHLDPVGHRADLHVHLAVGRLDSLQHPDALRHGLSAHVRHRRPDRAAAGPELQRHPPARHLLRHRPFPLHRGARHHLRPVRGHLLLVPQDDRADDERILGPGAFLALADLHEPDLPADVRPGHGGHVAAHGGRRRQLFAGQSARAPSAA